MPCLRIFAAVGLLIALTVPSVFAGDVDAVFDRVASHRYHPLNADDSFTLDRNLQKQGVADLDDDDWKIRLFAVRDLVRELPAQTDRVLEGLLHDNPHVRQISALALGIARVGEATSKLTRVLKADDSTFVRSQAAMSLGMIGASEGLAPLQGVLEKDSHRDIKHQCKLAIDQIGKQAGSTQIQRDAFHNLDESQFELLEVGKSAPDFMLHDTEDAAWSLDSQRGQWVILVWIFADWCPVCHSEFNELISMQSDLADANAVVATIDH